MARELPRTRNQHFVPQFLIRNFAHGKRKQVWVFDKSVSSVFRSLPRNLASERDFYNFVTSEGVSSLDPAMDGIDDAAAPVINGIVRRRSLAHLSESDRVTISIFAAVQMLRTRAQVEMWADLNAQMAAAIRREGSEPNNVKGFEELTSEESRTASWATLPFVAREIVPQFLNKSWLLYQTDDKTPFYLGDNPLVMHNTLNQDPDRGTCGLAVRGIEAYLPISSTLSLCFLCPTIERGVRGAAAMSYLIHPAEDTFEFARAFETGTPLHLQHENVVFQNSLQVANASRHVYCCYDQFDLIREMLRTTPELSMGPRIRMNWPSGTTSIAKDAGLEV